MLADQKLLAGDIDGGLADYAALVNDRSRVYGPAHQQTFDARLRHAFALADAADGVSGRIAALEALLDDQLSGLGPDDPLTMTTPMHLAHSHRSDTELQTVLADQIRVFGPAGHPARRFFRQRFLSRRG
jgi:hypothetical protein